MKKYFLKKKKKMSQSDEHYVCAVMVQNRQLFYSYDHQWSPLLPVGVVG